MFGRGFRLFLSSTFEDMQAERRLLAERVFPQIEELCRTHGAELQVIDLRWGVSAEAVLAQRTRQICLREIERCRTHSLRPSFLALVGQRYGDCPLPDSIPASAFQAITEVFRADPRLQTLREWYRLDQNAIPPQFVLGERRGAFADEQSWIGSVTGPIQSLLRESAGILGWSEEERVACTGSLTHQEIYFGGLRTAGADPPHAFSYVRTIPAPLSWPFVDLLPSGAPDEYARRQITALRDRLTTEAGLPCRTYTLASTAAEEYSAYMDRLCADVLRDLSEAVRTQLEKPATRAPSEAERHAARSRELSGEFVGREQLLAELMSGLSDPATRALHLVGPRGSGKTSLLARLSERLERQPGKPIVITRFAGFTPGTGSAVGLLRSVIVELAEKADKFLYDKLPNKLDDLVAELNRLLVQVSARVFLILDDADRLTGLFDPAFLCSKATLKLCASFTDVQESAPGSGIRRIPLPSLEPADGEPLLRNILSAHQRTLIDSQFARLMEGLTSAGSPQWLVMAARRAITVRSFDELPPLAETPREVSLQVLGMLTDPSNHGQTLVWRLLAYLRCSRFGFTEREVIALLEEDDEVMAAVRATVIHPLPVVQGRQRIPTAVWSRLLFELEPFFDSSQPLPMPVLRLEEGFSVPSASQDLHYRIAAYFERWESPAGDISAERAATELLHHELRARRWQEASRLLSLPQYIAIKARHYGLSGTLDDYASASSAEGFEDHSQGEMSNCKELILHLAGAGPRTIEEHEQLAEQWPQTYVSNKTAFDLRQSPVLQRTAALLAHELRDYAELYALWETIFLAGDRDAQAAARCFVHRCELRPALIPLPHLAIHMKKYPVTVKELAGCYEQYVSPWRELGDGIPATGVNWREASFFSLIHGGRLPTLEEWMSAAGAAHGLVFPWGSAPIEGACNSQEAGIGHPTQVDQFDERGASIFGVCDLVGNVWEFTATSFPTIRNRLAESDFAEVEHPAIVGGSYAIPLTPGQRHLGAEMLRDVSFRDLKDDVASQAIDLFEHGYGSGNLDIGLFDAGAPALGFRYVIDFDIEDYVRYAEQILESSPSALRRDSQRCSVCGGTAHPGSAAALATSTTSPAIACATCLDPCIASLREAASQWGDGRLFYGHSLMPLVAEMRNVPFQQLPHVRTADAGDAAPRIDWF